MAAETNRKKNRGAYEWVQVLVCSVVAMVLLFAFGARVIRVDGSSMRETLQHNDLLLVPGKTAGLEQREWSRIGGID